MVKLTVTHALLHAGAQTELAGTSSMTFHRTWCCCLQSFGMGKGEEGRGKGERDLRGGGKGERRRGEVERGKGGEGGRRGGKAGKGEEGRWKRGGGKDRRKAETEKRPTRGLEYRHCHWRSAQMPDSKS